MITVTRNAVIFTVQSMFWQRTKPRLQLVIRILDPIDQYTTPFSKSLVYFPRFMPVLFLLPAYQNQNSFYSKHTIQNDKTEILQKLKQKLKHPKVHLHQIDYHYWLAVSSGTSPDVDTLKLDNCREDNALQLEADSGSR